MHISLLRKAVIGIFMALLVLLTVGCFPVRIPIGRLFLGLGLKDKTPYDYPGTKWVSTDPSITLMVAETEKSKASCEESTAFICIDGENIPVTIIIDSSQAAVLIHLPGQTINQNYLEGEILRSTKDEVRFSVEKDYFFSGKYDEITLKRVDGNGNE